MSAKDTVKRNKTAIQSILSGDHRFILQKVYEKSLITEREYNNLKSLNKEDAEGQVIELVDKIMNKGEDVCKDFLNLLQCDADIKTTFPRLNELQLNFCPPASVQAGSRGLKQDGSSQMEGRSSTNKEDAEGHVTELGDNIMNKGQDVRKCLLILLQNNDIKTTLSELKNEQLDDIILLVLVKAYLGGLKQDGSSQMEARSYSTNREDPELGEDTRALTSIGPQVERLWIGRSAQHSFQNSLHEGSYVINMDLLKQYTSEVAEPCFSGCNAVSTIKNARGKKSKNKWMCCTGIFIATLIIAFFLKYRTGETVLVVKEQEVMPTLEQLRVHHSSAST